MEVRNLLTNKVTITERNPNQPQQKQSMNLFNKLFSNPSLLWTVATIIVVLCLVVCLGVKWACGLLAIWITASLVFYFMHKYGG